MNTDGKTPWLNLWMIILGAAGLLLIIRDAIHTSGDIMYWVNFTLIALLLSLALIVGIARWSPESHKGLAGLAGLYLTAWRTLWRNGSVLFVFGFIALINAVGSLANEAVKFLLMPERLSHTWVKPWNISVFGAKYGFINHLLSTLEYGLRSVSSKFLDWMVPGTGLTAVNSLPGVVFALVVLVSLIWIQKRLKELSVDNEYADDARFVQGLILPLAIVSAAVLVGYPMFIYKLLLAIKQGNPAYQQPLVVTILQIVCAMGFSVMANGILIGGLAGSLNRSKQHQPVTRDTFIRDAVRYFKPLAGIYLIMYLASTIIYIPLLVGSSMLDNELIHSLFFAIEYAWLLALLLLMFAPYAPVVCGDGSWAAIRRSIRDWIANWKDVLSFIALGFSLLVLPFVILDLVPELIGPTSWLGMILSAPLSILRMVFVAISAVAVWEFYNLISSNKIE